MVQVIKFIKLVTVITLVTSLVSLPLAQAITQEQRMRWQNALTQNSDEKLIITQWLTRQITSLNPSLSYGSTNQNNPLTILDLGSGNGAIAELLLKELTNSPLLFKTPIEYIGVDNNYEWKFTAQRRLQRVMLTSNQVSSQLLTANIFNVGRLRQLLYFKQFDVVIMSHVAYYLKDYNMIKVWINEVYRYLLKDYGMILAIHEDDLSLGNLLRYNISNIDDIKRIHNSVNVSTSTNDHAALGIVKSLNDVFKSYSSIFVGPMSIKTKIRMGHDFPFDVYDKDLVEFIYQKSYDEVSHEQRVKLMNSAFLDGDGYYLPMSQTGSICIKIPTKSSIIEDLFIQIGLFISIAFFTFAFGFIIYFVFGVVIPIILGFLTMCCVQ